MYSLLLFTSFLLFCLYAKNAIYSDLGTCESMFYINFSLILPFVPIDRISGELWASVLWVTDALIHSCFPI